MQGKRGMDMKATVSFEYLYCKALDKNIWYVVYYTKDNKMIKCPVTKKFIQAFKQDIEEA
jgi:hypothetical protein